MENTSKPEEEKKTDEPIVPEIIVAGKSTQEIVEQELAALYRRWNKELVQYECDSFHSVKVWMVFSINKQLDMQFIWPADDIEYNGKFNYPNSCLIVKLRSKRMPYKLIE